MPKKTACPRPLSWVGLGKEPGASIFQCPVRPVTNSTSIYDLVQVQGRQVGRLKEKDSRFQYLCCWIEDFIPFGSQPKSENPTLSRSAQYGGTLDKPGMLNSSTQSAQSKSWNVRSKSQILQQDLLSRSNTLEDTTAISPLPPVTSSTSTDPKSILLKLPKRSHTQAFNSKPDSQNVDNSFTSTSLPPLLLP